MGNRAGAIQGFVGDLRERNHLENLVVDWRIILKWMLIKVGWGDMYWIIMVQDRDRWWALVNVITNLQVPLNVGNFLTS